MTQIETHQLRIERIFNAPIAKVRDALTNPELLADWYGPGPMTAEVHSVDARVGGQYEITMTGEMDGEVSSHTCTGTFTEVTDTVVAMTFNWSQHPMPNDTDLRYELEEVDGGTKLVLTHTGFPNVEARDNHNEGWTACVDQLAQIL
jgi:glutathione S-transferase